MTKAMKLVSILLGMLLWSAAHAGKVTYVYTDAQGTPVMESDAQGHITARFEYTPYGVAVTSVGAAPDGPGYTGHVNDPETGLVYMQARYYDPMGRMLSVDPVRPVPGDVFGFNRYMYANNNPYTNFDPTGTTCKRSGSKGDYSCQIDYIVTRGAKGKVVVRPATAADHKAYADVEKSLTNGVNAAASSGKTVAISVRSGGNTFTFNISGAKVAQNLSGRSMVVDPSGHRFGAMYSPSKYYTYINKAGINPARNTRYGNADRTRSIEFLHEGIHWSFEEIQGFGNALPLLGTDPGAHQRAYNDAANELLEEQ